MEPRDNTPYTAKEDNEISTHLALANTILSLFSILCKNEPMHKRQTSYGNF